MPAETNPLTGQEYYAGSTEDVIRFAKSLNIDQGRLASVKPTNVLGYMQTVEGAIDGYLAESYFLPIKPYNQVKADGTVGLVFPQRLRMLAQMWTAGLMLLSEFQSTEQNLNDAGQKLVEDAKKEVYQMTLWNHRIPGQRYKSVISHTMPVNFEPPQHLVEQLWQM